MQERENGGLDLLVAPFRPRFGVAGEEFLGSFGTVDLVVPVDGLHVEL